MVSLQLANHEIGNLYPIAEAARLCRQRGALLHCDAVQAVGRVPIDVAALGVDALTLSAHKLRGPRGVGALWVRASLSGRLSPLCVGGGQERGLRAGTENLPAIVGFGVARALLTDASVDLSARAAATAALRDRLEARLLALPGARRHGDGAPGARTPGTCNVAFAGVEGDVLLMALDLRGAAVSTGAACSSGSPEPSPVIRALGIAAGLSPEAARARAREALRDSLGAETTQAEVDPVAAWLEEIVAHVRSL